MEDNKNQLSVDKEYIISELEDRFYERAIPADIQMAIDQIARCEDYNSFTSLLNSLLINPNHRSHQYVTRLLQHRKSPASIPYIKQVLDSGFAYLEYTCSESGVIAKWFSRTLAEIGTKEAIDVIKEFAESDDEGIKTEMRYRLERLNR